MQRLSSLRDGGMQTDPAIITEEFPPGPYAYCLNLAIPGSTTEIIVGSKRMMRDFRLISQTCAFMISSGGAWFCILGTEETDWCADFVRAETIFGNGALPHFIPDDTLVIPKGQSIVVSARNNNTTARRVALMFQGIHL